MFHHWKDDDDIYWGFHCIHSLRCAIKIVNNGRTNGIRILSRWDAALHVDVDKKSSCRKMIYPRERFSCFSCRKSSGNPHSLKTIAIILNDCVQAQVLADCVSGANINKTLDRDLGRRLSGWFSFRCLPPVSSVGASDSEYSRGWFVKLVIKPHVLKLLRNPELWPP